MWMDFCQCLKVHSELFNCKQWQKDAATNKSNRISNHPKRFVCKNV